MVIMKMLCKLSVRRIHACTFTLFFLAYLNSLKKLFLLRTNSANRFLNLSSSWKQENITFLKCVRSLVTKWKNSLISHLSLLLLLHHSNFFFLLVQVFSPFFFAFQHNHYQLNKVSNISHHQHSIGAVESHIHPFLLRFFLTFVRSKNPFPSIALSSRSSVVMVSTVHTHTITQPEKYCIFQEKL